MNGKDMFRGMEYVGDDLIEEAERCQFRQPQRRIHSPLLVAAMIALMLFLMGCAVAFVLRMSNLKIGAGTAEQDYSLVDGVYVKDPHTITTTTLTLAGLEGSDTYKACAALYAYGEKYKAENADWTGYSDAMHARAQELAEQYGLKPEGRLLNFRTVRHLCDALGIERFTNNDPAISADIDSGRCYDTGNFQLEMTFRFPENSGDNITCVRGGLRWNRKDCFSADYVTLVDNGDWVERNYTTMSGNTVLILRSPSQEQGYILCDREEALMTLWLDVNLEVYSEVGGVVSVERLNMTDEQLEKVADTIDFAISPQTPTQADVDAQANFFHSATQNGYTVQLKSVETDGYVAQIRLGITAPADVDIEGLDVRIGDNSFTTAGRQLNRYSGGFDAVADGDGQSNTKDFLGEFCISFLDGLRPFAVSVNDQIKSRTRLADKRNELLAGTVRIIGVVVVHQRQIALRGQCAGFLIRDSDGILLHDFRQNGLLHRGSIALIGKSRSGHADAQHRRQQQCAKSLKLHPNHPPCRKLRPQRPKQPGSGWKWRTAVTVQPAAPV